MTQNKTDRALYLEIPNKYLTLCVTYAVHETGQIILNSLASITEYQGAIATMYYCVHFLYLISLS